MSVQIYVHKIDTKLGITSQQIITSPQPTTNISITASSPVDLHVPSNGLRKCPKISQRYIYYFLLPGSIDQPMFPDFECCIMAVGCESELSIITEEVLEARPGAVPVLDWEGEADGQIGRIIFWDIEGEREDGGESNAKKSKLYFD